MKGVWKFVGGAVVGAASAIVMSPKSGSALRREMALRLAHGLEKAAGEEPAGKRRAPAGEEWPGSRTALPPQPTAAAALEAAGVPPESPPESPARQPRPMLAEQPEPMPVDRPASAPSPAGVSRLAAEAAVLATVARASEPRPAPPTRDETSTSAPDAEAAASGTSAVSATPTNETAAEAPAPERPVAPEEPYARYGAPIAPPVADTPPAEHLSQAGPPVVPPLAMPLPVGPPTDVSEHPGEAEDAAPVTEDAPPEAEAPSPEEAVTDEALEDLRARIEETRAAVREALEQPFGGEDAAAEGVEADEPATAPDAESAVGGPTMDERVAELRSLATAPAAEAFSAETAWSPPGDAEEVEDEAEPSVDEVAAPASPEATAKAAESSDEVSEPPVAASPAVPVEATAEAPPSEAAIETVEQEDVEPSVEAVAAPPSAEGPEARVGEAGVWVMPEGETESAETVDQDLDDQPGPSIAPLPDVEPAPLIKPEPDSSTEPPSVATPELGSALVTEPEPAVVEEPAVAGPTIIDEETVTVAGPQPGAAEPTEEASVERSSVDRAVTEAFDLDREEPAPAAGEAAAPVDQAAMRRRIEETRNRLKAKAFDAMAGGEAALLSKEQEPSPSQQAVAPGAEEGLDDDVKAVIDRSLSQDDY